MIKIKKSFGHVKPTTLVRVVALLGFGACAVMLGIVSWALSNVRSERERLDALQTRMTKMVTSLDTYQLQERDNITALLGSNSKIVRPATGSAQELSLLIGSYKTRVEIVSEELRRILSALDEQIANVEQARQRCQRWNDEQDLLVAQFPIAQQEVRRFLDKMRTALISKEGRVRLERALQIRRYREAGNKGGRNLALSIIDGMAQESDLSTAKTELADLALLCERLLGETELDDLADLKDNEFKSTLDRLERVFNSIENRASLPAETVSAFLGNFRIALFGQGYMVGATGQTIEAGENGMYDLCKKRLVLRQERESLHAEALRFFDALGAARQRLVEEVETYANDTAAGAEQALGRAWETMLIVGLVSMAFFLVLSARIAKTVRKQIVAIEKTNENLKKEISERERIEHALRHREDELRIAKRDLEVRVEERTADLQIANEHLEREVAEKKHAENELRRRGYDLSQALDAAKKARLLAEEERDRSEKILAEVSEAKRRAEILLSDATAREARMIELKREVNDLMIQRGAGPKYGAPARVDDFLSKEGQTIQ